MINKFDTDKSELENKVPNVTDFVKKEKLNLETKFLILIIYQQKVH